MSMSPVEDSQRLLEVNLPSSLKYWTQPLDRLLSQHLSTLSRCVKILWQISELQMEFCFNNTFGMIFPLSSSTYTVPLICYV